MTFKNHYNVPNLEAQASKLKIVGKAGNALQLVNVGIEGVKLNGAIDNAQSEYDNNTNALQQAYSNQMKALWDLYKQKKISLVDYRRQRLAAQFAYEDSQMAADSNLENGLWLSGCNFVKDSLTAMTPVPGAVFDKLTNFGMWVTK